MMMRDLETDTYTDKQQAVFSRIAESCHSLHKGAHNSIVKPSIATLISIFSLKTAHAEINQVLALLSQE